MADLFLRGRGAHVGTNAPAWLVRLAGAVIGIAIYTLADLLGVFAALGFATWYTQLALVVAGFVLAPTRLGSALWITAGFLTVALFAVSYTPLVAPAARAFVREDANGGRVDAIVVLSGGVTAEGLVRGQALDRLITGAGLARRLGVSNIALSVVNFSSRRGATSEADQRELTALMVPGANVRFVASVWSTRDEALAFAALARTHHWQRVALVTSPLHTRRACKAVEAAGLAVQCVPAAPRDYPWRVLRHPDERRQAFADVVYESAATMLYAVRGWL